MTKKINHYNVKDLFLYMNNMIKNNPKSGFTLIELLVVITIIWILATWAVTVYTSQIQKARDTTRINDIKSLQSWIEQFYQDTSMYPQWWKDWLSNVAGADVQDYSPKLARDPKDFESCNGSMCGYAYIVAADSNGISQWAYEISTAFEDSWNRNTKAWNDSWGDAGRLEFSVWVSTLDTSKAVSSTATWWTTALTTVDATAKVHIGGISKALPPSNTVTWF